MKTRIITGTWIGLGLVAMLAFSHVWGVLQTVAAVLGILGVRELYRAAKITEPWIWAVTWAAVLVLAFLRFPGRRLLIYLSFLYIVLSGGYMMNHVTEIKRLPKRWMVPFALAACTLYGTMSDIREVNHGLLLLTLAIAAPVITDVGAYFVGRAIGKRKLAPVVSPNKTVEGAVGGVVLAVTILLTACLVLKSKGLIQVNVAALIVYLLVASLLGEYGDLTMSAIKRIVGIKDYANLFPGHGGVLDRFDSLLFVLPLTWIFSRSM